MNEGDILISNSIFVLFESIDLTVSQNTLNDRQTNIAYL